MTFDLTSDRERCTLIQQCLVVLAGTCLTALSVWVLSKPPARGYETIPTAYSTAFWAVLITGFVAAALVFVFSSYTDDNYWVVALLLVGVLYSFYDFLPLFRGWAMYGQGNGDVLSHVGYARAILDANHIPDWNFYPGFHVLLAEFNYLGFEMRVLNVLFSALFTVLYLCGVFLLTAELTGRRRVAVATLFVATLPVYDKFHHTFHPAIFSFMLTPIYLFVFERYRRTKRRSYLVVSALLSVVFVVSHPATTLYVVLMSLVAIVGRYVYSRRSGTQLAYTRGISVVGFTVVLWAVWYSQFEPIRRRLLIVAGVVRDQSPTVAESYGQQELAMAPTIRQIIVPFVDRYGPIALVLALSCLVTAMLLFDWLRGREPTFDGVWLTGQYAVGTAIGVVSLITFTAALTFNPIRNARYMVLIGTILTGMLLYSLLDGRLRERLPRARTGLVCLVVLLALMFPVAIPGTYYPHTHFTHTEEDGTTWFFDHRVEGVPAVSHHVTEKMRNYDRAGQYADPVFEDYGDNSTIPKYFGYRRFDSVGAATTSDRAYLVTKQYDTAYYRALKPFLREESIVYTDASLRRLRNDSTANRLYTNGGYRVWEINRSETTRPSSSAAT